MSDPSSLPPSESDQPSPEANEFERSAEAAAAGAEEQPRRGWLYRLFSPETRLGRFMRPLLRLLALIVGLFALGLLAGYLLLYRPAAQALEAARADLQAVQQQLSDSEAQRTDLQSRLQSLQQDYEESQAALVEANARVQILKALPYLESARTAIAGNRTAAARTALESAQAEIDLLLPLVQADNPDLATQIETRLKLVLSELAQEPRTADMDLRTLIDRLEKLEKELAGQ